MSRNIHSLVNAVDKNVICYNSINFKYASIISAIISYCLIHTKTNKAIVLLPLNQIAELINSVTASNVIILTYLSVVLFGNSLKIIIFTQ